MFYDFQELIHVFLVLQEKLFFSVLSFTLAELCQNCVFKLSW
jgi:hypothetical protein